MTPDLSVAAPDILPDYLAPQLDVVFVGAAPSLYAAESGHYYAGPRNRFWLLLHQAGFTPYQLHETEDAKVLQYGIGLTGLMKGYASSDNSKLPAPAEHERDALYAKLRAYSPRVVCYNGKDVYKLCTGRLDCRWGLQAHLFERSMQFVVHSSSGRADGWGADRLYLYRELRSLILAPASVGEPGTIVAPPAETGRIPRSKRTSDAR